MFTHNFDPILIDFGFIAIRWYSLSYIFGILIGWWYGKKIIAKKLKFSSKQFELQEFDDLISYLIISIIIGGRLGYVIFYNLNHYILNPLDVFKIWEGGMSFHGALIGIIIGTYLFSSKRKIQTLFLLDIIACVAPIGIFLGRIANFINGELVGKISSIYWSVIFPKIDMMPRHPSQLYEAFLEGFLLFIILNKIIFRENYKPGTCSYLFLIFYGVFRVIAEIFREPDAQLGYIFSFLSMGMILSFAMIFFGLIIYYIINRNNEFQN